MEDSRSATGGATDRRVAGGEHDTGREGVVVVVEGVVVVVVGVVVVVVGVVVVVTEEEKIFLKRLLLLNYVYLKYLTDPV